MNATTLAALAEPNRLKIVELLRENPRPVGEIASRLRMRQPQASKHLRVLAEAGIVDMRPAAQQRVYYLQAKPFKELDSWLDTFRPTWDARLDMMEDFLAEIQHKRKPKA
jgi:DNA-binding transcriptional ArsR family regulator